MPWPEFSSQATLPNKVQTPEIVIQSQRTPYPDRYGAIFNPNTLVSHVAHFYKLSCSTLLTIFNMQIPSSPIAPRNNQSGTSPQAYEALLQGQFQL